MNRIPLIVLSSALLLMLCILINSDRERKTEYSQKLNIGPSSLPSQQNISSCSQHDSGDVNRQAELNEALSELTSDWPKANIESLKALHTDMSAAIDRILKTVPFETYASLPTNQAERLIRYSHALTEGSMATNATVHLCWGTSTPAVVVEAFESVRALALQEVDELKDPQQAFQGYDRWTFTATDGATGSEGAPVTLTWSFVPDGTLINNDEGQTLPSNLIAKLNTAYGSSPVANDYTQAPWFELFEDSFQSWADITGNSYVYEPNDDGGAFPAPGASNGASGSQGIRGDIRIAGVRIDGNSNILAFNYFPNGGDMVIDTDDSSNFTNTNSGRVLFQNTISHEHGHGLGLNHVCPTNETKLMEPFVSDLMAGPQLDEILTAQEIYGDPLERSSLGKNNNTAATANDLGTLNSGIMVENLSISSSSDVDVFKFNINSARQLNVSVSPSTASAYLEGAQNNNGSCSAGTLFNPNTRQNLIIRVLDQDSTTVIASADATGIGQVEALNNVQLLNTGQSYYVEISGGGENSTDANNAQLYTLNIELLDPSAVQLKHFKITEETCTPANGSADPGEIVTGTATIQNIGTNTATNVSVTLTGSTNLNIQGDSIQTIGSIPPGASIDVNYTFSISGDCLASETVTVRADSDTGFVEHNQLFTLGSIGTVSLENFDSTNLGQIPNGYNHSSNNSSANWRTVNSASDSSPNSVFSPGLDAVNSAYISSPTFTDISSNSELRFDHSYNLEDGFDGGILEIAINGGAWVEWLSAGGSYTQNGYNDSISPAYSSPVPGSDAWTGNSNGFIQTIASFPPAANGNTVQVRWHLANDESENEVGWWIDNIELTGALCCETTIPTISVTAPSPIIEEFTPDTSSDFIVTADMDVIGNLVVAYTLSGNALSGSDFIALAGTTTIPSGQDRIPIAVNAIADNAIEGDETITLTLSPSVNYGIDTASANMTIKDLPFDEFRYNHFGAATVNVAADQDFDYDGILNLVEYGFRLDPNTSAPLPFSLIVENSEGPTLELTYYEDTELVDLNYIVETSTTLLPNSWTASGVTIVDGTTNNGLKTRTASITIGKNPGFIRIRVERVVP